MTSSLIGGVGADAEFIAEQLDRRCSTRRRSLTDDRTLAGLALPGGCADRFAARACKMMRA